MDSLLQELGLLELKQVLATDTGHPTHAVKKSQRNLVGYSLWDSKELDMTVQLTLFSIGVQLSNSVIICYKSV